MAFLESELSRLLFNLFITALMVKGFQMLWNSAQTSLKNSGGKWTSILDECILGFVGIAVLYLCWSVGPIGMVELVVKWVKWLWALVSPILRSLGFPV